MNEAYQQTAKNNEAEEQIITDIEKENQREKVQSQFYEKYLHAFRHVQVDPKSIYAKKLHENNIKYNQNNNKKFYYKVVDSINNFQIVSLDVYLGNFTIAIKIINVNENSPFSNTKCIGEGTFGKIYAFNFIGKQLAIKSYGTLKIEENLFPKAISRVIKQYCITKISGVLDCGPLVINHFGFDIIIFQNRIQFSMEKCLPIYSLSLQHSRSLLENLRLLHQYKIVHMDINQFNLMFSKTRQKLVYIDFGFSEVICEQQGFKTLTEYKGTPQFVSKQMLNLFSVNFKQGYVDLYHNDLVCYENTLKLFARQKGFQKEQQNQIIQNSFYEITVDANYQQKQQTQQKLQNINEYQLIYLKYCTYFKKQRIQHFLAQNHHLINHCGKKILLMFTNFMPSKFFQGLLFNSLKGLSHFEEYTDLLRISSNRQQRILPKSNQPTFSDHNYAYRFIQREEQKVGIKIKSEDSLSRVKEIAKHLKNKECFKVFSDKQKYFSLFIDCIRFDKENISYSEKQQLSIAFLSFAEKSSQKDCICEAVSYLLSYCYSMPENSWKDENRFLIMVQSILLDINVLPQLSIIKEKCASGCFTFSQIFYTYYEHFLLDRLLDLKHSFKKFTEGLLIVKKVKQNLLFFQRKMIKMSQLSSEQAQISKTIKFVILNRLGKVEFSQRAYIYLDSIKNQEKKNHLTKILFYYQIQNTVKNGDQSAYLKAFLRIRKEFSQRVELNYKNFVEFLFWNFQLIYLEPNKAEFIQFSKEVKEIFNFDEMFDRFVFKFYQNETILRSKPNTFKKMGLQLIQICSGDKIFNRSETFLNQIHKIVHILSQNNELFSQNKDLANQIARIYVDYVDDWLKFKIADQEEITQDQILIKFQYQSSTFQNIKNPPHKNCDGCFYLLLFNLKQTFPTEIERYQTLIYKQYWKTLQKCSLSHQYLSAQNHHVLFLFYNLKKYHSYFSSQSSKVLYFEKQQLKMFGSNISPYLCKANFYQIMWTLNGLSLQPKWNNKQLVIKKYYYYVENMLIWGWRYQLTQNYMLAYMVQIPKYQFIITDTLLLLWGRRKVYGDGVYQFLSQIAKALSQQPQSQYVKIFNANIIRFYVQCKQFFIYDTLKVKLGKIEWNNRYQILCFILAIKQEAVSKKKQKMIAELVKHFHLLSPICKQEVLIHYYQIVINLKKWLNHRKIIFQLRTITSSSIKRQNRTFHQSIVDTILSLTRLKKKKLSYFKTELQKKIKRNSK